MAIPLPRHSSRPPQRRLAALIAAVVLVLLFGGSIVALVVDYLWFQELGYVSVLTTRWFTESLLWLAGLAASFATLAASCLVALRRSPVLRVGARGEVQLGLIGLERRMPRLVLLGAVLVALGFAASLQQRWLLLQIFLKRVPYGTPEPIFGNDAGFYLFTLPFLRQLVDWVASLAAVALAATGALYLVRGALPWPRPPAAGVLRHLGVLAAILLVLLGVRLLLAQYDVLLSPHGAIYGAGYADVKAHLPGMRIAGVAAFLAAALVLYGSWRGRALWLGAVPLGLMLLYALVVAALPALLQKLVVEPNELAKERPYIEHALRLTREAWDLDTIEERPFDVQTRLDPATLDQNRTLVENIRLWDWKPLLATYGQIQEMRLYYDFGDVDIDRYVLDGQYRQVMLSARELSYSQIPEGARTWVNLHLKYTHGFGLCMSPVNRITREGLPELFVRDIPPVSSVGVRITRPEIYYGEQTRVYSVVGTSTDEFDYPMGEKNQMARYAGRGGIPIGSLGRRLLLAAHLRSRELLLTGYLTPQSRILLRRSLQDRIPRLAPFLRYDGDPYLVVDDGRLLWIQDAYTTSTRFPYSPPQDGVNYMRNAVKVVVDAYDGTTLFYVADPRDAVLRVYQGIFPSLFRPLAEMPPGLRAHLRYPEDLFDVQARVYAVYHMRDPQVFYNREDLWSLPVRVTQGGEEVVQPYYTMLRLPGSDREELILMLPFTPARKDNMIAWLAARCDGEALGKRQVFLFPKQQLVYGPRQISARIDQDPAISQLLTLWNQRGSSVIRGNLLVIPIGNAILYVEPLYLQADRGALPELKRVILAQGDRIEMGPDLNTTLALVMGGGVAAAAPTPGAAEVEGEAPAPRPRTEAAAPTAQEALDLLQSAETALQRGDWVAYGESMQRLRQFLQARAGQAPAERTTPP